MVVGTNEKDKVGWMPSTGGRRTFSSGLGRSALLVLLVFVLVPSFVIVRPSPTSCGLGEEDRSRPLNRPVKLVGDKAAERLRVWLLFGRFAVGVAAGSSSVCWVGVALGEKDDPAGEGGGVASFPDFLKSFPNIFLLDVAAEVGGD